jgi:hypothetical protein
MEKIISIKYRRQKFYCQCCEQKLPKPKTSDVKEFEFDTKHIADWADWKDIAEFEEDLQACVEEYVYDTIRFFATSSDEKILIEPSEIDKMKQFILNNVVNA